MRFPKMTKVEADRMVATVCLSSVQVITLVFRKVSIQSRLF